MNSLKLMMTGIQTAYFCWLTLTAAAPNAICLAVLEVSPILRKSSGRWVWAESWLQWARGNGGARLQEWKETPHTFHWLHIIRWDCLSWNPYDSSSSRTRMLPFQNKKIFCRKGRAPEIILFVSFQHVFKFFLGHISKAESCLRESINLHKPSQRSLISLQITQSFF